MRSFIAVLFALGFLFSPTPTQSAVPPTDSTASFTFRDDSEMTVYGGSNVRSWTMDVTQINGAVVLRAANGELPSIQKIDVEVPVQKVVSEKDRLQRHAHEALKKEEHPTITFTSSDVQVAEAQADSFSVVAKGNLTIAGETHPIALTAKGTQQADSTLTVVGRHGLKLSTYDVERPSLMFGAIKVDDPVEVGFEVVLVPRSQSAPSE